MSSPPATSGSARSAPSAASRRSSSSRIPRPASATRDLQDAVAAEALRRGILSDSSTTSLNLQPSLLMPPEAHERALGIVAEATDAVIAALPTA